ncbi:hypothetical protein AMAG_05627 [Allomyces macrogynus ATCC 38327]|uniref:Transmembrane protein n=1 Tax=Allomyces macrogynus (strain ATCC 38327) TaxID=578462 RepID=A0A0L0SCJ9_ALLM3|nr:hypothetical protein AMAG_05627 [Allomyces macrogynus ATCC 38327]|eukprot:KNE60211.1 hypothetical protein AMAG_05627 [Allomyces macrogynus ATCC 38327]
MEHRSQHHQSRRVYPSARTMFTHALALALALAVQPAMADNGPTPSTSWLSSSTATTSSTSITTIWGTGTVAIMRGFSTPSSNTFAFNSWDSGFNKTANSMITAVTISMVIGGLVLLCAIVAVVIWITRRHRFDQPVPQAPVSPPPARAAAPIPTGFKPETMRSPTGASSLATTASPSPLYSTDPQPEVAAIRPPATTVTAGNEAQPTQQPARNGQARFVIDPDPVYLPPAPIDQEPLYLPARVQPLTAVSRPALNRSSSI